MTWHHCNGELHQGERTVSCGSPATVEQPPPVVGAEGDSIHDLVVADILDRKALGLERYGSVLHTEDGRSGLIDAYQEALDQVCYLRKEIEEQVLTGRRDSVKMLRETFCVAQTAVGQRTDDPRTPEHIARLQRLIDKCDQHRPLGPDGKHGQRHTPTCGCEDQ